VVKLQVSPLNQPVAQRWDLPAWSYFGPSVVEVLVSVLVVAVIFVVVVVLVAVAGCQLRLAGKFTSQLFLLLDLFLSFCRWVDFSGRFFCSNSC
jgi:hypothetical protein